MLLPLCTNGRRQVAETEKFSHSSSLNICTLNTYHFIWIEKLSWPNMKVRLYEILWLETHQHQALYNTINQPSNQICPIYCITHNASKTPVIQMTCLQSQLILAEWHQSTIRTTTFLNLAGIWPPWTYWACMSGFQHTDITDLKCTPSFIPVCCSLFLSSYKEQGFS